MVLEITRQLVKTDESSVSATDVCRRLLLLMLLSWTTAKRQKRRNRRSGCRKALASHMSSLTALTTAARQRSYAPLKQENYHPLSRSCTVT